ncbi:trypsin-like peptidase domain-containing protein [Streptomyces sp. NPDC017095]|uniref:VMAP-C domain-containing protein n=1 Tax=Streptomyces sp. NPDC017095 TaxID=3364977 RepID=UPI0037A279B8
MGWFRQPGDAAPTLVSVSVSVSVSDPAPGDPCPAGAGALLSPQYVLTCAHVVNAALGRTQLSAERPASSEHLRVVLRHDAEVQRISARLAVWVPPRRRPGSHSWEGDLAVLELAEPAAPSARAVAWQPMTERLRVRAWHGGGDPSTFADTTIKFTDGWYYYADADLSGASVQHGYSGAPLFKADDLTTAVGIVTSHLMTDGPLSDRQVVRRSLALPWQRVREELVRAEAHDVVAACLPAPFTDTGNVPDGALDLVRKLFDHTDQMKYQAHRLATALGYRMAAEEPETAGPTLEEELTVLLFTEGRALATLAELLTDTVDEARRETLDRLLGLGLPEQGVRLLSVGEHRRLLKLLRRVNSAHPTLLCQAARHVLQLAHHPPAWADRAAVPEAMLAAAVDDLDAYRFPQEQDSVPLMPQLLRLAVFLSAAVADRRTSKELDTWCDDVRRRLGRDRSLLTEWRAQASSWARFRRRPVTRIVVDLSRDPAGAERYFCHIWRVSEGRAPEGAGLSTGPYTAEEIGRLVHTLVKDQDHAGDAPAPWIDVVVGRDDLHLPVDGWTAYSTRDRFADLGLPPRPGQRQQSRVLGATYRTALRLRRFSADPDRERARRHGLRRRWAAGRTAPVVLDADMSDADLLSALDGGHRDTAWAVLHGEPAGRDFLLHVSLAMGVPVVLWDREAAGPEHARRLEDIIGTTALPDLPELLQDFRKGVYHDAEPSPARPAMVWDDPDMHLPVPPDYDDPSDAPKNWERLTAR